MSPNDHRTEFHVARTKLLHGSLIAGLLAVVGLWMIFFAGSSVANSELLGLLNLALAAGIFILAVRKARDPRPHLVLDEDGLWYRDWGIGKVPWRQISEVSSYGIRLNSFACIELRDHGALLADLTAEQRRKLKGNRLVRPPRLLLPNGALDAPLEEVLEAIRAGKQHASHPTV